MTTKQQPVVATSVNDVRRLVVALQANGKRVGLVPTMGALHEGHLHLVKTCSKSCDACAVSIFVNPAQFGPSEDFERYPRELDRDLELLSAHHVDVVFAPKLEEVYRPGHATFVRAPQHAERFEGEFRPGHFEGVCTVVLKLFHAIPANVSFFGQKDYQQFLVVRKMVQDLNLAMEVTMVPTVRAENGLALSSRNRYLAADEREQALSIHRALRLVADRVASGETNVASLADALRTKLEDGGIRKIDYAAIVCAETLTDLKVLDRPAVALVAAHVGNTRLIDNELLSSHA